jgi:hypothetical protein
LKSKKKKKKKKNVQKTPSRSTMGRFLPSHLSSLLAPATYPLLQRGYSICIDRGVSAANCKAGYILATCICVCVSIVFLALCIHSAWIVARHLRRRRAQMDARNDSGKLWLPISNHVIDRAQFDRTTAAVRAQFDADDERVGLLDMASCVQRVVFCGVLFVYLFVFL